MIQPHDIPQLSVRSAKARDLAQYYATVEKRSIEDVVEAALVAYATEKYGEDFVWSVIGPD